ncbi:hypothetical protein BGZ70_000486 [Mortierella alpina]|uniref:V-SNARE coiled-coil homology domain-containing protein n=1 Tax=Mortierella alpina TaxID=64518 RepID=A0A9P6LYI8_MORAP|nr:hypothetical protein BGZ70_000486 [Mortierella alpina]
MAFLNKLKAVVQTEGSRGIRQVLQKEGTKRFAQDLSAHLDLNALSFCETRRYGLPAHISAIAVDPVQGLLASGTFKGAIAVTGAPEVTCYLELEEAVSVKMLTFQPGVPVLIVVDAKNAITIFDLIKKQRLFVRNARSIVTCMELLSGSNWLFHGLRDGTVDVFDVYRGQAVPYRIPNIIPEGQKHSLVVSIKTHPKDNNQLLIAYNTGIALWNLKTKSVIHSYIYEIPPGAMGGLVAGEGMFGVNESRYPHVTVIAWRPDGLGFVSGYDDGCFVFWDVRQERPILARTIHEVQVNIPGIRPAFERTTSQFVPIYQLSWCLHSNLEDTTLIVAGGTSSVDMYGLHLFDYPAKADYRSPRRHQTLAMESDILDFVVLPRNSPWYNGALDPVSILVLTNRGGVRSFAFNSPHAIQAIPSCLSMVEPRLTLSKLYGQLPVEIYDRLVHGHESHEGLSISPRIPLRGLQLAPVDEARLCRDILVTAHMDCSIRFWEGASFRPLHHLTVELGTLFFKNQADIVAFEFSVSSQVLAVGFSNGNWIYTRISSEGLSRQSSIARSDLEQAMEDSMATHMTEALRISEHDNSMAKDRSETSPASPLQPDPTPHHSSDQDPVPEQGSAPQPEVANVEVGQVQAPTPMDPVPHPAVLTTQDQDVVPTTTAAEPDTRDPAPPLEPTAVQDLPPGGLNPAPPLPDRAPSPSLPPRPQFVEASLLNGSVFHSVFKSSSHLGKINQMAVSGCGLVAVSDEFYSLSITDARSGKVLHVEDLKVVMLDRDKPIPTSDGGEPPQRDQGAPPSNTQADMAPVDPAALQRVGVVISSLQFVVSTTCDQEKVPSLLLIAGSTQGIHLIYAISSPDFSATHAQPRRVRRVECFQTKEQCTSVHTSIINVISPSENAAGAATALQSTSSVSTASTMSSQYSGSNERVNHPPAPQAHPPRPDETGTSLTKGHRPSESESSQSGGSTAVKPSIYSSWKETQEKVKSKAQQRLNYLVLVSEYGIRLHMNCTSRRIHKIDLSGNGLSSKTGRILAANVVYHGGACCILCVTESGRVLLYSVPKLELIPLPVSGGELFLPIVLEPERLRESVILPDGRLFVPILKYEFRMYSLWGHDRWIQTSKGWVQETSAETSTFLQVYDHGVQIPPRPTQTAAQSRGWFGLGSGSTAEEAPSQEDLDKLLGGDHYRPENPILKRAGVKGPPGVAPAPPPKDGNGAASTGIAGMMNETLQGLDERGKKLGLLGDKTAEMSAASNDFLAAARELNAKNANKKWYEL